MSIARESLPFALPLAAATVLAGWLSHPALAVIPFLLLLFTLWFFRDPERSVPEGPRILVSPADGRIIRTGPDRISIFMNVFNVHVCRSPMAGQVGDVTHVDGRFLAAFKDEASEHNERTTIELAGDGRSLRFTLIAGLIARRIVSKVREGQQLSAGQRVGLIRFGSRVDVEVPPGGEVTVELGQRVVAGETVIVRLRN